MLLAISIEAGAQGKQFRNSIGELLEIRFSNGGWGLWNSDKCKWIIQPKYESLDEFGLNYLGYCSARDDKNNYCVYDLNGKLIIPSNKYSYISVLPRQLFIVNNMNHKVGIVDINGRIICPFGKYDQIYQQGSLKKRIKAKKLFICAQKKGKVGLIDVTGKPVTDFVYDWIDFPSRDDGDLYSKTLAEITYKENRYFVDFNWNVIRIENKHTGRSLAESNQNTTRNTYNSRTNSNSGVKTAAAIGVFIGLAACIIDAISSSSSSSSSSSYSSYSSSSSSYSSSSSSTSLCSYCTGRGMMNCSWCGGSGIRSSWIEGDEVCVWCKGRGQVWCYNCNGRGSR